MANEKRLRLLALTTGGSQVKLGAALSASSAGSSDTITFNGALEYGDGTAVSIGSDQYLPVVVDPDTASAEEIWVTDTPNASFQAACVRGVGSSTGAPAHSSGALVTSGPMPTDLFHANPIDVPWGGNLGYDYEFQGDTTSLPSGWSWVNQGNGTYSEAWGNGSIYLSSANSGDTITGIQRSAPAPPFTVTAKVRGQLPAGSGNRVGLVLSDSTGLSVSWGKFFHAASNTPALAVDTWTAAHAFSTTALQENTGAFPDYLQIVVHSATDIDFNISFSGSFWFPVATGYNPGSALGTPSEFGVSIENTANALMAEVSWFRVR